MAFNLKKTLTSVEKTPEAIRALAERIVAGEIIAPGTTTLKSWANAALRKLENYEEYLSSGEYVKNIDSNESFRGQYVARKQGKTYEESAQEELDEAYLWITGAAQPTKGKRMYEKAAEDIKDIEEKIANTTSNLANILDIPADASPELRTRLEAKAAVRQAELDELISKGQALGIDVSKAQKLIRTKSGFIPQAEGTFAQRSSGRAGEPLQAKQDEDGMWKIVGVNSGNTYESGIASVAEANRRTLEIQAGFAEPLSSSLGTGATYLDGPTFARLQGLGLTEDDIVRDGERIYLKPGITEESLRSRQLGGGAGGVPRSSSSSSASATVVGGLESGVQAREEAALAENPSLVVTPEMRAQWLAESYDELRGNKFYDEVLRTAEFDLGTSLNRLISDTRLREVSLAQQYKENLRGTQQSLQERGLLFGGVRRGEERELADKANLGFASEDIAFQRGLQDITQQGERYFGSDYAAAALSPKFGTTQSVGRVLPGSPVFQAGERTQAFSPMGGFYGSFPREVEEEARTRAGEKESAFRDITSIYS